METLMTMFASFVAFCGGVIFITETINRIFKIEGKTAKFFMSWGVSLAMAALGFYLQLGFFADCGAITACIEAATGKKPHYAGKPDPTMIYMASEKAGIPLEKACMIGDRLYTDIALGKSFGVTSVLVLSGETTEEDVDSALPKDKPDFAFASLDDVDKLMF